MNIVIFGDGYTFPDGDAPTNRVHTYAKGFVENGTSVHVICFANEYNTEGDGIFEEIHYYHPFGQRNRSRYFVVRRWHKFLKYFKTLALFRKISKKEKVDGIIVYTMLLSTHLFAWLLSGISGSGLLKECGEHPLRNFQKGVIRRKTGLIKLYIESRLCEGIICITQFLVDFYKNYGIRERKLLLIPSTVDTERFKVSCRSPLKYEYILYCGRLNVKKDGVNILIESFVKISGKYPGINLVLLGKGDSAEDEVFLKNLVKELNTGERVIFLGQLSRTEVPAYLINAKILALARPKSMVADAGFPSKLTEYLATGIPVVVTEVGEIPVFLKDKVNAFISKPDSVGAFSEKLEYVLENYHFALEIAKKGQELTESTFNYNYQSKRIIEFVKNN